MKCRFSVALVPLLLTACLGSKQEAPRSELRVPNGPEERIATSFERLEVQVAKLVFIQKAERKVQIDEVIFTPTELNRRVAYYKHRGHLARIVQDLAEQAGYEFRVFGRPPNIPVIVAVEWVDIPIIDALKDAGVRAAHRATVYVNAEDARIEVRYD